MKVLWWLYAVSVIVIAVILGINNYPPFKTAHLLSLVAPVPNFFTTQKKTTMSLWLPNISAYAEASLEPPELTAKSALLYDLTTGKTLYSKDPTERMPMASLTKIMTGALAIENQRSDDTYIVRGRDLVGEDSMGLSENETLTLKELLYGLVLHSGNDAAETIADNYPQGRNAFIAAMNNKVTELGLSNTHFSNPSGLEGDGMQYTTAYDLLVITKFALSFSLFREVAKTAEITIPQTSTHAEYDLYNETNLLTTYPGVEGVKTGYTPEAGYCLVTLLNYQGHQIIGVILDSQDRRMEMKELLDYSLQTLGITPPPFSG